MTIILFYSSPTARHSFIIINTGTLCYRLRCRPEYQRVNLTVTHVYVGIILYNFRNSALGTQKILSGYDIILLPTRKHTALNELGKNASELRI